MTTVTPKVLVAGQVLTASAASYYPAPTGKKAIIKAATLTNTTAAPVAVTVYRVPSGGTAGASNTVISAYSISNGTTYACPELVNKVLETGDSIQALGLGVSFDVSGVEIG